MAPAGITVSCIPVFVGAARENWSQTWHGIQEVTEQFLKLQFYRFYVLLKPVTLRPGTDNHEFPTASATTAYTREAFSPAVVKPSGSCFTVQCEDSWEGEAE